MYMVSGTLPSAHMLDNPGGRPSRRHLRRRWARNPPCSVAAVVSCAVTVCDGRSFACIYIVASITVFTIQIR
jgi:hypothetical protein